MTTAVPRITLAVCLVLAAGAIGYLSLRRRAYRIVHWFACAWMQCDEAPVVEGLP